MDEWVYCPKCGHDSLITDIRYDIMVMVGTIHDSGKPFINKIIFRCFQKHTIECEL